MKLKLKLNQVYKSLPLNFEVKLSGPLVVLSGVNGSGKSQLLQVIRGRSDDSNETIEAQIHLNGQNITLNQVAYRSFKENIQIPEFGSSNAQLVSKSRDQVWAHYSQHRLNPKNRKAQDYVSACLDARGRLIKEFGKDKFNSGKIYQEEIKKAEVLNGFIWRSDDMFTNLVSEIFYRHALCVLHARAAKGDTAEVFDHSALEPAPWQQLNALFEKLNLSYRFKENYKIDTSSLDLSEDPVLYEVDPNGHITNEARPLKDLSDGEKAIIALTFGSLSGVQEQEKKVILLDEFDAVLNPSLIEALYTILNEYFIRRGLMVILATHSPVTISLAPEQATFYEMFKKGLGTERVLLVQRDDYAELQVAHQRHYSKILKQAERIEALQHERQELIDSANNEKHQLYLEGVTDISYIEAAAQKLGKQSLLSEFDIRDGKGKDSMNKHYKGMEKIMHLTDIVKKHIYVFDCDASFSLMDKGNLLHKRILSRQDTCPICDGVENMFRCTILEKAKAQHADFFEVHTTDVEKNGATEREEKWLVPDNKKTDLCEWICKHGTAEDFASFEQVFSLIDEIINSPQDTD
jgi:ABC-type transport system involved in cytochrome c biogenesis ATPase subunit